jgi:hypothetical protein
MRQVSFRDRDVGVGGSNPLIPTISCGIHSGGMKTRRRSALLCLALGLLTPPLAAPVATAANAAVVRHWSGEYRNESIATGERRGSEKFDLLVHPDGSHTLSITSDMTARHAWFTVVLRQDSRFTGTAVDTRAAGTSS